MNLIEHLKSIGKYKEGMTVEEIAEALKETNIETGAKVDKSLFDKTASELADIKKKYKEKQTDDEKKKEADEAIAAELANAKRELSILKQTSTFTAQGYDAETAKKLSEHMANGEMDKFAEVTGAWLASQKEAMKASLKDELLKGQNPPPQGGSGGGQNKPAEVALAEKLGQQTASQSKASTEASNYYFGGK